MTQSKNKVKNFFNRSLVQPLIQFLKQGLTPEKLAMCVALGVSLGTFPVLGSTTLLCTIAAFAFRLNMPAIQLINYFAYPLQLLLFIPFIRAGEFLFSQAPIPLDIGQIFSMLQTDMLFTIQSLWWANVRAIVAWFFFALPVGAIVYYSLRSIFSKMAVERKTDQV